ESKTSSSAYSMGFDEVLCIFSCKRWDFNMTVWICQTAHFVSLFHAAAHNPVCLPGHHFTLAEVY
ncbi:hypothetical protein, partial [Eisenbergiella massiliensis]|uniref:hypothetical protein n=1 Tax=Eisenbergiella massiliensis TaxID=1720294 RepID=UPI001A9A2E22